MAVLFVYHVVTGHTRAVAASHPSPKGHQVTNRTFALFIAATLVVGECIPAPAHAENQMGYQLLTSQEAAALPHNHGSLGMDIERSQQITDGGMTFDLIRVKGVRRGSPGAQAGFNPGDQIIAVDGRVFPSLVVFAEYVGSVQPGTAASVDYIPANGGPAQAQRVAVTIGTPRNGAQAPAPGGMSTGTKVAIGVGAAALLGCYELGCFSHRHPMQATTGAQSQGQQPSTYQPQPGVQR